MKRFNFQKGKPKSYWDIISRVIDDSHVVLEVLDARMPELSRNSQVESLVLNKGKKLVLVLNKADLVSKSTLESSKKSLLSSDDHSKKFDVVYVSSTTKTNPKKLIGIIFKSLKGIPRPLKSDGSFGKWVVGIVGYPNTGKSSLINLIARRKKAKVSRKAGTTHGPQWIKFGENVRITDSPGIIPLRRDDPVLYGLLGVRDPERISNLEFVSEAIIEIFLARNKPALEKFFGITIPENSAAEQVIGMIAYSKGFVKKGGLVDENRTHVVVVRAWNNGSLKL